MRKYENNIVISVIIPTYNNDKTIIEAIQSIVNVEMPVKYEVLVIDDGFGRSDIKFNCRIYKSKKR